MMLPHLDTAPVAGQPDTRSTVSSLARQAVFRQLKKIRHGSIELTDVDGTRHDFGEAAGELTADIQVGDARFYRLLVNGGANGAAEAWCLGFWHSHTLVHLLRLFVRNRETRRDLEASSALGTRLLRKMHARRARNTRRENKLYIAAHYDLGNSFFAHFLDDSMMYSAAVFDPPEVDLLTAQTVKLQRICDRAALQPGMQVLEIGSGWGGFAVIAALEYGCDVTTTTISEAQYRFTCERVELLGLQDRVQVIREDYRDLSGQYDAVVSIEMIEAIGAEHYDDYFAVATKCLKPGGRFVLQAITIGDCEFERARHEVDFIKQYIFPGSCIPSEHVLRQSSAAAGLVWERADQIGQHYATTLTRWRENFLVNLDQIRKLDLPDNFIRMWLYYFCYCEAGFREGYIDNLQIILRKPTKRLG